MIQRTQPKWDDPYEHNGNWCVHVENLWWRDLDLFYKHDVISGSPVFPHPSTRKAHGYLRNFIIHDKGDAYRAWWWLREDVGVETFMLPNHIEKAVNEAVMQKRCDVELDSDDLSPFGQLP